MDDAVRSGAKVLVGGKPNPSHAGQGNFYLPTVLAHVTNGMKIAQEEVFGPVMTIIKVRACCMLHVMLCMFQRHRTASLRFVPPPRLVSSH